MTTSANVIEYIIEKNGGIVGYYRQNILCKTKYHELLKFKPISEHTIQAWWYDEEEDRNEDEPINLETFLKGIREKELFEYFKKYKI